MQFTARVEERGVRFKTENNEEVMRQKPLTLSCSLAAGWEDEGSLTSTLMHFS